MGMLQTAFNKFVKAPSVGSGGGAASTFFAYDELYFPAHVMTPDNAANAFTQGMSTGATTDWRSWVMRFNNTGTDNKAFFTWFPPQYIDFADPQLRLRLQMVKDASTGVSRFIVSSKAVRPSDLVDNSLVTFTTTDRGKQIDRTAFDFRWGDGVDNDCGIPVPINTPPAVSFAYNMAVIFMIERDNTISGNLPDDLKVWGAQLQFKVNQTATVTQWPDCAET